MKSSSVKNAVEDISELIDAEIGEAHLFLESVVVSNVRHKNGHPAVRLAKQAQLPRTGFFCLAWPRRQIRHGRQVALQLCMQP